MQTGSRFNPILTDADNSNMFLMQSATVALTMTPDGSNEVLNLADEVREMLQQYNVTVAGES